MAGNDDPPFGIYNGVRTDYRILTNHRTFLQTYPPGSQAQPPKKRDIYIFCSVVDFPFSFAGDTVLLPIDCVLWAGH